MDLECNHCGSIAFTSRDYRDGVYWFTDGDGEACDSCGMPGSVVVDEPDPDDAVVYWSDDDSPTAFCTRPDCEDCNDRRAHATGFCKAACEDCKEAMANQGGG